MITTSVCEKAVEQLIASVRSGFETYPADGGCVIATPFAYPDLASIEIYVREQGDQYVLSDEGETLNMLFVNGLSIEAGGTLVEEAKRVARSHGVTLDDSVVVTRATAEELGYASARLVNAMQALGYLLYKRRHNSRVRFDEEVEELLLENEVPYRPNYQVHGKANTHRFRFFINSDRNVLLEPISASSVGSARRKAELAAYSCLDIRQVESRYRFAVVIDDRRTLWDTVWSDAEARSALETHVDTVLRWEAERAQVVELLSGG